MTSKQAYNELLAPLHQIYDSREARNIADWVFENTTGINRLDRVTSERDMDGSTQEILNHRLSRLLNHVPVQYILNEAWFYKMKFYVNEHVLIPRPETEELVDWIVEDTRETASNRPLQVVDIGSGSGCIAIAIKKMLQHVEATSIDVSSEALGVAKKNSEELGVEIDFRQIDFLVETTWSSMGSFDIIVSNPPYIPVNEKSKLPKNVANHEPHIALFVKDDDPFLFYKKIAQFADSHLADNGKIYVEVHEDYSNDVETIFQEKLFKTISKKDINGKIRMVSAYR